jgi:DNA-binding MarR family transcriptional regulator
VTAKQPDDNDLVDALLLASRALVGVSARSLAGVDEVTLPQFRALVVLAGRGSLTASALADLLDIHPSTATRLCDRLVRKQLIRRAERRADRREVEIVLAAKGRRLVESVQRRRRRDLARLAQRMTAQERRDVVAALEAFARAAGETPEATLFAWPETPDGSAGGAA